MEQLSQDERLWNNCLKTRDCGTIVSRREIVGELSQDERLWNNCLKARDIVGELSRNCRRIVSRREIVGKLSQDERWYSLEELSEDESLYESWK